jgi:DnaJ-class molecular chaperone
LRLLKNFNDAARSIRQFAFILTRYDLSGLESVFAHSDTLDSYQVLGIDHNASAEEVKQAYRREAMK